MKTNRKLKRKLRGSQSFTDLYLRNVPMHVKAQFKAHCAKHGESMTSNLIDHMRKCIKESRIV